MRLTTSRPTLSRLFSGLLLLSLFLAVTLQNTLAQTPSGTAEPTDPPPVVETATALASEQEMNDLVLFSTVENNRWVPYLIQLDGTGKQLLSEELSSMSIYEAALSPDRKFVAVEASIPGTDKVGIYLVTMDGRHMSLVLEDEDSGLYLTWLPDSKHIGFSSEREEGKNIYVTNLDGSQITRATPNDGRRNQHALWSPDGQKIAFWSEDSNHMNDLFVMNADGSDVQQLTDRKTPYGLSGYAWSPDSQFLVFTSQPNGTSDWNIYTLNTQENVIEQLTYEGNNYHPFWTPDGTKILFTSEVDSSDNGQLYAMKPNGLERTMIIDGQLNVSCARWMPDGETLVFINPQFNEEMRSFDIYSVNADGTGLFRFADLDDATALSGCINSFG